MNENLCRKIVYERSEQLCERCCSGRIRSVHHRKKRSQGGGWTPQNCVLLCGTGVQGCHGWVEHNPDAACVEGFHVRPWNEPEGIPLLWRGSQWVFLTEDGRVTDV
jgi:hypothetical protein